MCGENTPIYTRLERTGANRQAPQPAAELEVCLGHVFACALVLRRSLLVLFVQRVLSFCLLIPEPPWYIKYICFCVCGPCGYSYSV